ncbi:hypothetical protein BN7_5512 [Wickerhamomyces ciferrii]|uniref:Uncharacterized protein n=1 Tax=Wickerhamomyces ciferrii (strain ATCC 14091 / BCRC 22168 / CBS 111 / JCM 3599 / NBRC 0793 / NRRL Y-1031 F-60-10) TaxID=1206466 RepID=K0KL15_WICCF|nr:uncharacterized protein BN7_5512 [Wickerhamomyces ciferrii]CCH45925.1 hypothetical protein BN7_5512 [Wickerhamomyces ciferrii]
MQLLRRNIRGRRGSRDEEGSNSNQSNQSSNIPRTTTTTHSRLAPELLRTASEETLINSTHRNNYTSNNVIIPGQSEQYNNLIRTQSNDSNMTHVSRAETFVDLVLGHSFHEFNEIRTMPVVSGIFQKGTFVFPSEESLNLYKSQSRNVDIELRKQGLGIPLLQICSPMLSAFKKNSPTLVIYKFKPPSSLNSSNGLDPNDNPKFEFCKIYFKYLKMKIAKYVFQFMPNGQINDPENETIVMYISSATPYADVVYRNTRLRWIGTTNMSSTFGSGFFKLIKLNDDSPSLTDNTDEVFADPTDPLLTSRDPNATQSQLPPLARFSDRESSTMPIKRTIRHGDVKMVEVLNNGDRNSILDVPYCSLVITCLALVLRDQESKKNHGNPRFYETNMASSVFY